MEKERQLNEELGQDIVILAETIRGCHTQFLQFVRHQYIQLVRARFSRDTIVQLFAVAFFLFSAGILGEEWKDDRRIVQVRTFAFPLSS